VNGRDESIFSAAVKVLFLVGIVIAAIAAFVPSNILPWVVGGTGLLTGFLAWKEGTRGIVILAIVLVVSLSAIREQYFNPHWLTDVVFFIRVFVAHVGLASGLLGVLLPRTAGP
jgi:hypothetical protein